MRTKEDLLALMTGLGACGEAMEWVTRHELDLARDIWEDCHRVDWMVWFAFRLIPGREFAYACADRAARAYWQSPHRTDILPVYDLRSAQAALDLARPTRSIFTALKAAIAADTQTGRYASEATSTASNSAICAALDANMRGTEIDVQLGELRKLWPRLVEAARV